MPLIEALWEVDPNELAKSLVVCHVDTLELPAAQQLKKWDMWASEHPELSKSLSLAEMMMQLSMFDPEDIKTVMRYTGFAWYALTRYADRQETGVSLGAELQRVDRQRLTGALVRTADPLLWSCFTGDSAAYTQQLVKFPGIKNGVLKFRDYLDAIPKWVQDPDSLAGIIGFGFAVIGECALRQLSIDQTACKQPER